MQVRQYLARRLMILPILLIGTSMIVFTLTRVGGSPIGIYLSHEMTQEDVAELEERYGLDEALPVQYVRWVEGVFRGDLGWSAVSAAPVTQAFPPKATATMELAVIAGIIAVVSGIAMGTFAGARRDRPGDHFVRVFSISGAAMPTFWFAIVLLIVFWVLLGWFPNGRSTAEIFGRIDHPTGFYTIDSILAGDMGALGDALWHLTLPAITLAYGTMAIITRMMRSSLVEEISEEYVDAARAKGLPERLVFRRHARRNALIPTATVVGLSFGFLLQGTITVEIVFRWPGIGLWMADAVLRGDPATIMAYVLFTSVLFLLVNLVVDIVYAYLDPRVALGT